MLLWTCRLLLVGTAAAMVQRSVFHAGEQEVQTKTGARSVAEELGKCGTSCPLDQLLKSCSTHAAH